MSAPEQQARCRNCEDIDPTSCVYCRHGAPEQQADRCPRCRCDDCGGRLDQHTPTGCTCHDCAGDAELACTQFLLPGRITLLAEQLGPLLSAHLHERARRRCLAVAHAAHHALLDYDYPEDAE